LEHFAGSADHRRRAGPGDGEAPGKEAITTTSYLCHGAPMLFYPAALPLSARTLTYVAGVIRRHRRRTGSRWRKLNPGRQALLVLA
jgi:hypothetical protein